MRIVNLFTLQQLSSILDISEFTIKKLVKLSLLPCEYINRKPRFNLAKVKQQLKMFEEDMQ